MKVPCVLDILSVQLNPHAVTQIGDVSYVYDVNGNLASTSAGHVNTWDYRNRLTQTKGGGTATTTYAYDHTGERVQKVSGGVTTYSPSDLYEIKGSTTTKNIYANGVLISTIQSGTPTTKVFYNHQDHLGSTNVVTDSDGYLDQVLAYYPYGGSRVSTQY